DETGCTLGPEREQALFGVRRWQELAEAAKFWIEPNGALGLAYREEAWAVLQEFTSIAPSGSGLELLPPAEVQRRFPAAKPDGLRGALISHAEAIVGQTQVVLRPRPNVTMVTAMGGLGMTLCWGLARETIGYWTS
ncbi:MAG: hypothetical protein ACREIC_03585, partial [Limisphaerales bacterium]